MRRDRCRKSVNQFTQKGQIIRTCADETRTFQASLCSKFLHFRSIIGIIIQLKIIEANLCENLIIHKLCSHLVWEFEGTFYEITPFGGNGFHMSAKWLFNDVESEALSQHYGVVQLSKTKLKGRMSWTEEKQLTAPLQRPQMGFPATHTWLLFCRISPNTSLILMEGLWENRQKRTHIVFFLFLLYFVG